VHNTLSLQNDVMPADGARSEWRLGARAVAPMLIAVIPFGLVAGASAVAKGLGAWAASGFSVIVFAGSSQLAAIDVLGDGGSALVAVIAACTINMRMLLYSASLSPHMAAMPMSHRLGAAYVLTDQAYAVSITRWSGGQPHPPRLSFYLGAGVTLWIVWQIATVAGALLGSTLPASVPLDFAVPLVFLVLLVPAVTTRPAFIAAAVGGGAAVFAAEVGAGPLSVVVGALSGIVAGTVAETVADRRAPTAVAP
jgi:predicted branched-subunit amino acid permease